MAQRIARCGPSNIARKLSPAGAHLATRKRRELRSHDGVVRIEQRVPVAVAELCGPARRVHDVGEEHGGENAVVGNLCLVAGEELGDLLEGRRAIPGRPCGGCCARATRRTSRPVSDLRPVLPCAGGTNGSSAWWRTRVGTPTVGSTARTSISLVSRTMRATVPGLAARRSMRAQVVRISSFHGISGFIMRMNSPVPHMAARAPKNPSRSGMLDVSAWPSTTTSAVVRDGCVAAKAPLSERPGNRQ